MNVAKMPKGCMVMLVYLSGDVEDEGLKTALQAVDVSVEVRHLISLERGLLQASVHLLSGDGPPDPKSASAADQPSTEAQSSSAEAEEWPLEYESTPQESGSFFSKDKIMSALAGWYAGIATRLPLVTGSQEDEEW